MNKTIKSYDKFSKELANKFDAIGVRVKDVERTFSYIKKENPRVLELGCANGRDAQEILKRTENYIGVDGSKELIKIAKEKLPQAKFVVNFFDKLKFPNQNFDIVFDFASLMHFDKDELIKMLKKISCWLDDDGILLLSMKEGEYSQFLSKGYGERVQYSYTADDILSITKNDYEMLDLEKMNTNDQNWFTMILKRK